MLKGINKNTHKLYGNFIAEYGSQKEAALEEIIAEYSSTKEAAMQFSKSTYSSISLCCNGKYKTAFGFKWKYKN